MEALDWIKLILTVIAGVATCIPVVVKLVHFVQKAIKERNWAPVMRLVMELMAEAEKKYTTGAEKKAWVIDMLKKAEPTLNYEIDYDAIGAMIDAICSTSKLVNAPNGKGA